MATKKFSWKEHRKWIGEFADAKIIYPSEKNTLDVDINWKKNNKKKEKKMTLNQLIRIQSIIDKRAIRSDTQEFLKKKRYSKSKDEWIEYGEMHIDHFIRVFEQEKENDDLLGFIINGFMESLTKKGFAKKLTKEEFLQEIQKEKKWN